jgi:hypothetical protein
MIDPAHDLSITKQAEALNISRGSVYYLPRLVPDADLAIMRRLDRLHLELPFAGSRMLQGLLVAEGHMYGRRPRCKRNLTYLRSVRVQPCIRPHMMVSPSRADVGRP